MVYLCTAINYSGMLLLIISCVLVIALVCLCVIFLLQKLERRLLGFDLLKDEVEITNSNRMKQILDKDFMSSEESEFEEVEDNGRVVKKLKCYRVRRLTWERKKLKHIKAQLDEKYISSLSRHARGMVQERLDSPDKSTRSAPDGPAWAVRAQ